MAKPKTNSSPRRPFVISWLFYKASIGLIDGFSTITNP
jgi:hypothetical protein